MDVLGLVKSEVSDFKTLMESHGSDSVQAFLLEVLRNK